MFYLDNHKPCCVGRISHSPNAVNVWTNTDYLEHQPELDALADNASKRKSRYNQNGMTYAKRNYHLLIEGIKGRKLVGDSRKLKIAMLGHKTMPARDSSRGGVEVVVEELATRMATQGHDVTCYNRTGCDNGGLQEYKGVKLKSVCTVHKKGLAAMTSSVFAAFCAAFGNYDVVHFHAEGPCAMLWLPKLFGKKCIATIHGDTVFTRFKKNSFYCGNDAHTRHGYRFGTVGCL